MSIGQGAIGRQTGPVSEISAVAGVALVANGGTGRTTLTDGAVLVGDAANPVAMIGPGATGTVLHGNTAADPSYSAVDLAADVTGILPTNKGGTNSTTFTTGAYLTGDGTGALVTVGPGSTGQIAISNGTTPAMSTMSGDATLVSGGAITLASPAITGKSAETAIADNDLLLISDTSESANLNKMTRANLLGSLVIPATSGINFGATTLAFYEQITFTPTFVGTGTAGTFTYTIQTGRATRIGNRVVFSLYVAISAITVAPTGSMRIAGLPFTSANIANALHAPSIGFYSQITLSGGKFQVGAYIAANETFVNLAEFASGAALVALPAGNLLATAELIMTGAYEV